MAEEEQFAEADLVDYDDVNEETADASKVEGKETKK